MELINRDSETIKINTVIKILPRISISANSLIVRFNKSAAVQFHLVAGSYMHFLFDLDRLYFYTNDDASGFLLKGNTKNGMTINNSALCTTLLEKFPYRMTAGSFFILKRMQSKINDETVIEVIVKSKKILYKKLKQAV